jgi:hypothetical protein
LVAHKETMAVTQLGPCSQRRLLEAEAEVPENLEESQFTVVLDTVVMVAMEH